MLIYLFSCGTIYTLDVQNKGFSGLLGHELAEIAFMCCDYIVFVPKHFLPFLDSFSNLVF